MYEKQSSQTLGYVRSFTYLGAANITSKQKSDMTKVAIKNENIISFDGVFHIMDVFSKLGFEKLTESVLGKRGSSGKAFCYGSIFGSLFFSYLCGGECLEDIITFYNERGASKKTSTYRTMTSDGRICPFPLWLRTWFS